MTKTSKVSEKDYPRQLCLDFLDPVKTRAVVSDVIHALPNVFGWIRNAAGSLKNNTFDVKVHSAFSVAQAELLPLSGNAKKFILHYFEDAPSPCYALTQEHGPSSHKRQKLCYSIPTVSDKQILVATWKLVQCFSAQTFIGKWEWSALTSYMSGEDVEMKWLCYNIVSVVSKMSDEERQAFLEKTFTAEQNKNLALKYEIVYGNSDIILSKEKKDSMESFSQYTVQIGAVLLPKISSKQDKKKLLVDLPSTRENLEAIALSLSSHNPVLLEGVVGSGKTCHIEHLAALTGRNSAPSLTKVQLGGQTDSKSLVGTYRCTENPGEFIWQPGSITRAVMEGHWLLLEDIDTAPMDVVSLLCPLLESRSLPVPGKGIVKAHNHFQLFATRRSFPEGQKSYSKSMTVIEKLFFKVSLNPLSATELFTLVSTKYPLLSSISTKVVEVYMRLSSGEHENDSDKLSYEQCGTVKTSGRLVSVRDLMKWCSRLSQHVQKKELNERAFHEAVDCFCAAIPNEKLRLKSANQIGAYLNIPEPVVVSHFQIRPDIDETAGYFCVGRRAKLPTQKSVLKSQGHKKVALFSQTLLSTRLLERVAVAASYNEAVLIVGETGTGKTSILQYLAQKTNNTLKVINMNQQSDSSDLLGGFKPVEMRMVIAPLRNTFEILFQETFLDARKKFLGHIMTCFNGKRWNDLLQLMTRGSEVALEKVKANQNSNDYLLGKWNAFMFDLRKTEDRLKKTQSALAFAFIEGTLAKAIAEGQWVLLDEINLASADTLECLSGLLESRTGSITLHERGDKIPVKRHSNFKLFACMNPATDVGKKDLPAGLRNRFTEFFMDELNSENDLKQLIYDYLYELNPTPEQIAGIYKFYHWVRSNSIELTDGTGKRPYFSLRTLCRALSVARTNPCRNLSRSIYEAFCLSFLTQLDRNSHPTMIEYIRKYIFGVDNKKLGLSATLPPPQTGDFIRIGKYWVSRGSIEPKQDKKYIITETVQANLDDIVRVVSLGKFPVLLQGDTSVGKTSLITYLASLSGNVCFRINNHQHTDLQEYIGSYTPDQFGKLVFKEGILVRAMREGHWVILDELNLAPTDVLEALNRLLDDNRELFIPEIETTVKAHPKFMLFATQNPPGQYGGRQVLSRAFRNRFVELHFDLIPRKELVKILHKRCEVPESYSEKMVAVLYELQNMRRESNALQGHQSFITLRDLFRWAERYRLAPKKTDYDWYQHLTDEGYLVLGCRVRKENEEEAIKNALQKHLKRTVNYENLFKLSANASPVTKHILKEMTSLEGFEHIVWTNDMARLFVLVSKALSFSEPVLLVGETGCGKTSVCQFIAALKKQLLSTVNCHLHTEGADFIGGLRPVRKKCEERLFEWVDGPLVESMKQGGLFLIDEISLADDSVLERLNSVLEPERTLLLAEKGGDFGSTESIVADPNFKLVGTMNPGGDFGKKELSPALRNRFTEIWCPKIQIDKNSDDVRMIVEHNLNPDLVITEKHGDSGIGRAMLSFLSYFSKTEIGKKCVFSIRDVLSWTYFINKVTSESNVALHEAYIHGACLVLIDSLGSGSTGSANTDWNQVKKTALKFLCWQIEEGGFKTNLHNTLSDTSQFEIIDTKSKFGITPFFIEKSSHWDIQTKNFSFEAPKTSLNLLRLLRGLQLSRPLLLEGSPGVGKTSLAVALAKASGHQIVRINLSEQTDVADLFGADLPVEGESGGHFAWRDGPLLQALKDGSWIVLDELNLASQQVLEGLNACFDHRGQIYISELNKTFEVKHSETKIFACQNPHYQGGNRKGLPKSFLNRFTQVYMEPFSAADMQFILGNAYPEIPKHVINLMVKFNTVLLDSIEKEKWGHSGGPWEFNLRDMFRWCDIMMKNQRTFNPGEFVSLIYSDRMRTSDDKTIVLNVYENVFPDKFELYENTGQFFITADSVQFGRAVIKRETNGREVNDTTTRHFMLRSQTRILESLVNCINMNWMSILIGSSGKGKTSMIQLLGQLVGKKLQTLAVNSEMDVTELLGGFEQADYGRHLQELINQTRSLVTAENRKSISNGDFQSPKTLDAKWQDLIRHIENGNADPQQTATDEAKHYAVSFTLLKEMLVKLQKTTNTDLSAMIKKCGKLSTLVEEATRINGGGTFEWVDSPLVQAIRNGDWLLIDGANLCSASVLDRLNALLEPNGVLTISERGVIDGVIPSIKPHPGFRLFLVMDQANGEISRAMRNRGLEIFITEDWNVSLDVQSLMASHNLCSVPIQCTLYKIHSEIADVLPTYKKPTLGNMMQTSCIAGILLELGINSSDALKKALMLSYLDISNKGDIKEEIKRIINSSQELLAMEEKEALINWYPLLVEIQSNLINSSELFTKQICAWLEMVGSKNPYIERASPLGIELELPKNSMFFIRAVLTSLMHIPTSQWRSLLSRFKPSGTNGSFMKQVLQLSITKRPKSLDILHKAGSVSTSDPRNNVVSLKNMTITQEELSSHGNKALLSLWSKLCLLDMEEFCKPSKMSDMSIMEISKAVNKKEIGRGSLSHSSIMYIHPLVKGLSLILHNICSDPNFVMDDDLYFQLVEGVRWRNALILLCKQVINKNSIDLFLPKLLFHWKKVYENFLSKLPEIPTSFTAIISSINSSFGVQCSPYHDIVPELHNHVSEFVSFSHGNLYKMYEQLVGLCTVLTPDCRTYSLNSFLASDEGYQVKSEIVNTAFKLLNLNAKSHLQLKEDTSEVFSKVLETNQARKIENYLQKSFKSDCNDVKIMVSNIQSFVDTELLKHRSSIEHDFSVQVWPILDHLVYKALSTTTHYQGHWGELLSKSSYIPPNCLWTLDTSENIPITYMYLFRISNCTSKQSKEWMSYNRETMEVDDEDMSPLVSQTACVLTYQLLCAFSNTKAELQEVPISVHAQREQQLRKAQSTIFHNWNYINDQQYQSSKSLFDQIKKFSCKLLYAVCSGCNYDCEYPHNLLDVSDLAKKLSDISLFEKDKNLLLRIAEQASSAYKTEECKEMSILAIMTGVLQSYLLSHMDSLDPSIKRDLLLAFYMNEVRDINNIDLSEKWLNLLRFSHNQDDSHPHIECYSNRLQEVEEKQRSLLKKVAYRSSSAVYSEIVQTIQHFMKTLLVPTKILSIIDDICNGGDTNMCDMMLRSCDNFVNQVIGSYPSFRDLLFPIIDGICLVSENLRCLCHSIRIENLNKSLSLVVDKDYTVDSVVTNAFAYPVHRNINVKKELLNEFLTQKGLIKLCELVKCSENDLILCKNLSARSLMYELYNCVVSEGFVRPDIFKMLNNMTKEILLWLESQDNIKKQKEADEAATYKYKEKSHATNETEEEEEEREFLEDFPDFQNHFENIDTDFYEKHKVENSNVSDGDIQFHDEHLLELIEVHAECVNLVHSEWFQPEKTDHRIMPLSSALLRVQQSNILFKQAGPIATEMVDKFGVTGVSLSNHVTKASLSQAVELKLSKRPFNIYQDASIQENHKVAPLLNTLEKRIDELLAQWPEHPALLKVKLVIKRVLDFSVTSPLIKMIIGLETIFEKAQEWEKNAHKGVSVLTDLTNIAHQIMEWREIELKSWKSCLEMVSYKIKGKTYDWWRHLYQSLGSLNVNDTEDLSKTLKEFIERAYLGDFEVRLKLLMTFHRHLSILYQNYNTKVIEELVSLTWNLYQYYNQFLTQVQESLEQQRKPIEKGLKEYIKMCAYSKTKKNNIVNFFAIKETVIQSRRALHRYMRKWKKILLQPASSYLSDSSNIDPKVFEPESCPQMAVVTLDKTKIQMSGDFSSSPLLSALPKFSHKCCKFIDKIMLNIPYNLNIEALEEFTGEIATSYQKLCLDASRAENLQGKEERVKQVRSIIHRKRESLTLLMKNLQSIGISHHKGNNAWKDSYLNKCLAVDPLDMAVSQSSTPLERYYKQFWPSCDKYYYRCIGRFALLRKAMAQPHADLNSQLIQCLTGYPAHLMLLIKDIRQLLPELNESISCLQFVSKELKQASFGCHQSTKNPTDWWNNISSFVATFQLTVAEELSLLSAYTTGCPLIELCDSSFEVVNVQSTSETFHRISSELDQLKPLILKYTRLTHTKQSLTLMSLDNVKDFQIVLDKISVLTSEVTKTCLKLQIDNESTLVRPLLLLHSQWATMKADIYNWIETSPKIDHTKATDPTHLEKALRTIFVSVQQFYKKYALETRDLETVADNYLTDTIGNFHTDISSLNLNEICVRLRLLCQQIQCGEGSQFMSALGSVSITIDNYVTLCSNLLMVITATFRSLTKFQSIILSIFGQLATKGFCRPSDVKEGPGDGQMSFNESGMGLAEGEGKKDVSDRFESEDQLESALQEGQEENNGDNDIPEDNGGIEMNQDFEGKMQDVKQTDDDDETGDDKEGGDDLDKQMGDIDGSDETLDEKLWDDDNEPENEDTKSTEEGAGGEPETESQMVAKEDDSKKEPKKNDKEMETLEEDPRKPNKETEEEESYGDDFTDDFNDKNNDPTEDGGLPDQLQLDDLKDDQSDEEQSEMEPSISQQPLFPEESKDQDEKDDADMETKDIEDPQESSQNDDEETENQSESNQNDNEETENVPESENNENDDKKDEQLDNKSAENANKGDEEEPPLEEPCETRMSNENHGVDECEPAEDDQSLASKDNTKDKPVTQKGGTEREEDHQEDHGELGESTDDKSGVGKSDSKFTENAHDGNTSQLKQQESSNEKKSSDNQRKPGDINDNKTVGNKDEEVNKGLISNNSNKEKENEDSMNKDSELYEHIANAKDKYDKQMADAATQEQAKEQPAPQNGTDENESDEPEGITDQLPEDTPMEGDETSINEVKPDGKKDDVTKDKPPNSAFDTPDLEKITTEGEAITEMIVERPADNQYFTQEQSEDDVAAAIFGEDILSIRESIEVCGDGNKELGMEHWNEMNSKMSSVALQLCEQLRLILEPTQASKLKGDFRTGKRLNMRKVIPYIASGFRKDKIWLRRTQPNKRNYQIVIAVDDSSSMKEINASNLARQGVTLVGKALELLEAGSIGIVSFGGTTKVLHPLGDPFSDDAGMRVMSNLHFDQRETNFVNMLKHCQSLLLSQTGSGYQDTVQLLLILSDGQTRASSDAVKSAVRAVRDSRIFVIFLVLDAQNTENTSNGQQYSFYDHLVFRDNKLQSGIEVFPFPYFLVIRDVTTLPDVLCSALRQWFELVSSGSY